MKVLADDSILLQFQSVENILRYLSSCEDVGVEAPTLKRVATFYKLSYLRAKRVVRGTARVVSNMQNASPQCTFPAEVVHCRNEWVLYEMF